MTSLSADRPFNLKVGVFDSGVGGLTVMRQIVQGLPELQVTYFGDTARLPYGEKSRDTIVRFSRENVAFLISQGVELIIFACHTASSLALEELKSDCSIPLLGVVAPAVERAAAWTHNGRIAILGTRGTIASGVYQKALKQRLPGAHLVPIACPLFVPLVEEHMGAHPATRLIARDYLERVKQENADTVVLACTHYPLLAPLLQDELGPGVKLVDAAVTCAEEVRAWVANRPMTSQLQPGPHRFFVSDDPEKFQRLGKQILGNDISHVDLVVTGQ